jgi:hypothetical protein
MAGEKSRTRLGYETKGDGMDDREWYFGQSYYMSVSTEQAAALVLMAESFWGTPNGASENGSKSRIFSGTYRTFDENWVAGITRGRDPRESGYPHGIVMTPDGPSTMQKLLEIAPSTLPMQTLVGILFPSAYRSEYCAHPVSFVFARELAPHSTDKPWRLKTAVPFVANWGDREWAGYGRDDLCHTLWDMELLHDLGKSFWPEDQIVPPTVVTAIRDGCRVAQYESFPSMVTAFIYFAQHQLHIECDSVPNVDEVVNNDFKPDWELGFAANRCFDPDPGRLAYWSQAFGIHPSSPAPV